MNTANKIKTVAMALTMLLITYAALAQEKAKVPRHFVGLYAGADLSNTSVFRGATYEYLIRAGKKTEFGIKGQYTFPYRYGNMLLFESGSNSEPRIATLSVLATGYFFTNAQKQSEGFFFNAEAGISGVGWQFASGLGQLTRPVVGAGLGWKWPLRNGQALRWTNGFQYTGPNSWLEGNLSAMTTLTMGF
jgi:hypothetical protein